MNRSMSALLSTKAATINLLGGDVNAHSDLIWAVVLLETVGPRRAKRWSSAHTTDDGLETPEFSPHVTSPLPYLAGRINHIPVSHPARALCVVALDWGCGLYRRSVQQIDQRFARLEVGIDISRHDRPVAGRAALGRRPSSIDDLECTFTTTSDCATGRLEEVEC